jgi:hypothetical protein
MRASNLKISPQRIKQNYAPASLVNDVLTVKDIAEQKIGINNSQNLLSQQKTIISSAYEAAGKRMRMPEQNFIQRKCAHCEEEEKAQRKPLASFIQKKATENNSSISDSISNQIQSTKGSGNAMSESTKSFMESRFSADFSNIKIHTGNYASQLSKDLNAQAFTVGNDIYFNEGKYQPGSSEGKHLLAHELSHTLQQDYARNNVVQKSFSLIQRKPAVPRKKFWLNIGFDSSAVADKATMKKIRSSIARGQASLASCCLVLSKSCNIDIVPFYDWNRNDKPAPKDGNYDGDDAKDNALRQKNLSKIKGNPGGLKILVTESDISQSWKGVRIGASANTDSDGILWHRKVALDDTMAHESGHAAGYSGGDIEGNVHSSDKNNLMSRGDIREANAVPDADWCEKMESLAK